VLVGISAIVVIPLSLAESAAINAVVGDAELTRKAANGQVELGPGFGKFIVAAAVAGFLGLIISQLVTGATTRAAIVATAGGKPSIGESYRFAGRVLGSLIVISLLSALVVLGGLLLLVIPGIVFAIRLVAAVPALVAENVRGSEALRRSWRLVKGDGWYVFGWLLVSGILAGLVSGLVTAPFGGDHWVRQAVAGAVASSLTTPFVTCVIVLIYLDLRARKEGLDRESLARQLREDAPA
jgi:hypothetical protein